MTKTAYEILAEIQGKVAVPKGHNNDFGGYKYRKAEDILTAARDVAPAGTVILLSDRIAEIGGQIFVIATASLIFGGQTIYTESGAMHPLQKKGMDASQITGTASSYARKYAMQGLFALDDGKNDPDSRDNRQENGNDPALIAVGSLNDADTMDALGAIWGDLPIPIKNDRRVIDAKDKRKAELSKQKAAA